MAPAKPTGPVHTVSLLEPRAGSGDKPGGKKEESVPVLAESAVGDVGISELWGHQPSWTNEDRAALACRPQEAAS